jgi:serine/threonine-protein kinase HipA
MKQLSVYYVGWGERWLLGTLADNGKKLLFEYSEQALAQGLELSPYNLRLAPHAYGDFPAHLHRLPGLISDALPDGWGLMLMDKLFRKSGRNPASLSPLDRLAYLGDRALGALTFEPSDEQPVSTEALQLQQLAQQAQSIVNGFDSDALKRLALLGGSPHGARPKVLVYYNPHNGLVNTQPFVGATPWLVKFQAQGEHKEACAIEQLYAQLARLCQLNMPETAYFDLDKGLAAFGIERFDVQDGMRVPIHTLAGVLHADFRTLGAVDYTTFLRITRFITKDIGAVKQAFERCVFNVLFNNRDDHAKNISFRLNRQRQWALAPAYDLTFNEGPGGEHQMDILGNGKNITRALLVKLAESAGLSSISAKEVLERMVHVSLQFKTLAADYAIRPATRKIIQKAVEGNARLLA